MKTLEERVASMPYRKLTILGAALFACLALVIAAAPASAAEGVLAHLRVVAGPTLADQDQVTGTTSIKSDPNAECFGSGTGGSGDSVTLQGANALGIVKDASQSDSALLPISVTDHFYSSFGSLGVCGFGGYQASGSSFWYVKVNHTGLQVGGDQYPLNSGDDVLWYLSPSFPPPDELSLSAPNVVESGQPFTVKVTAYDDSGAQKPVDGAGVTGADFPTGPDGTTTLSLTSTSSLQALHGSDIPSNQEIVCVASAQSPCAPSPSLPLSQSHHLVIGTNHADRIKGTKAPDLIRARGGNDHINARGGLSDIVNCGRGRDLAIIDNTDTTRRCERVITK
jgi:hypothetical protein